MMIRVRRSKSHFRNTVYLPWPFSRRKFIPTHLLPYISAPAPLRKRNFNLGKITKPQKFK